MSGDAPASTAKPSAAPAVATKAVHRYAENALNYEVLTRCGRTVGKAHTTQVDSQVSCGNCEKVRA